jgi:hypothetical protein
MMKRVTWFAAGMAAGVAGTGYASRKVKKAVAQLAPTNIAKRAAARARGAATDLADAVREGRHGMHEKEAELRARMEPEAPITPGQVIVLPRGGERERPGSQRVRGHRQVRRNAT